jgi:GntR family transcriptional regulator
MFQVRIDRSDQRTLHEQVAAEIRHAISNGEAAPGERLPPAKDFAKVIGVNTNTVLRALHQLREEGIVEFQQGRGITVSGAPERGLVRDRALELIGFARRHGYRPDELVQLVQQLCVGN